MIVCVFQISRPTFADPSAAPPLSTCSDPLVVEPISIKAACAAFRLMPLLKPPSAFEALTRLPVTSPDDMQTVLAAILGACEVHDDNCISAGPTVMRYLFTLNPKGIRDPAMGALWLRAVGSLSRPLPSPLSKFGANISSFRSSDGLSAMRAVLGHFGANKTVCVAFCHASLAMDCAGHDGITSFVLHDGPRFVCDVMMVHPLSVRVQRAAGEVIARVARSSHPDAISQLIGGDCLRALNDVMDNHSAEPTVLKPACDAIAALAASDGSTRRAIVTAGSLARLQTAMKSHLTSLMVQESACSALGAMAESRDIVPDMIDTGALQRLLAAMAAHLHSPDLQQKALWALACISNVKGSKRAIVSAGALYPMYAALSSHPDSVGVVEVACGLVRNLFLSSNVSVLSAVVDSGCVWHLYAAMSRLLASLPVQIAVIETLCTLVAREEGVEAMLASSAGTHLTAALKAHPASAALHTKVCRCIESIAGGLEEGHERAEDLIDYLEAVLVSMAAHVSDEAVQLAATSALYGITRRDECSHLCNRNAIVDVMFPVMSAHPGSESIQTAACGVVDCLAGQDGDDVPDAEDAIFVSRGVLDLMYDAMSAHPMCEMLNYCAVSILFSLATREHRTNLRPLRAGAAGDLTRAAMANHPTDELIQDLGTELLEYLDGTR